MKKGVLTANGELLTLFFWFVYHDISCTSSDKASFYSPIEKSSGKSLAEVKETLNSEQNTPEVKEKGMSKKARKRIYNPWTKSSYSIRQRSSEKGKKGTIKGKWKPKKRRKRR